MLEMPPVAAAGTDTPALREASHASHEAAWLRLRAAPILALLPSSFTKDICAVSNMPVGVHYEPFLR